MKSQKYWQRLFFIGVSIAVLFWSLYNLSFIQNIFSGAIQISRSFIIGFAIAFVLDLPMKYIERKITEWNKGRYYKWYRIITVILSFLMVAFLIWFIIFLVLPDIQNTLSYFIGAVPGQIESSIEFIRNFIEMNPGLVEYVQGLDLDWNSIQSNLISNLRSIVTMVLSSVINYVPMVITSVFDFVVSVIFAVYLLFSKESLIRHMKKLVYGIFNIKWANFFVNFGSATNKTFSAFIGGQIMAGFFTAVVLYILMMLFNFPYRLSISVLTGITTLIPFYGAIFGGIVGFLLISVVNISLALWFGVLIVIVQQIEGNIIYPNVVGNSIGLPGIWVMVTVTIGGALFGLPGMFLSVPIFSLFYRVLSDTMNYRLQQEHLSITSKTKNVSKKNRR